MVESWVIYCIYEVPFKSRNMRMPVCVYVHKGVGVTHATFLGSPPLNWLEWEVNHQWQCGEMELKLIASVCSLLKASGPTGQDQEQRVINNQCYILPIHFPKSYLINQPVSLSILHIPMQGLSDKIGNAFVMCH